MLSGFSLQQQLGGDYSKLDEALSTAIVAVWREIALSILTEDTALVNSTRGLEGESQKYLADRRC